MRSWCILKPNYCGSGPEFSYRPKSNNRNLRRNLRKCTCGYREFPGKCQIPAHKPRLLIRTVIYLKCLDCYDSTNNNNNALC